MSLDERLKLVKFLEQHKMCLEHEANEDSTEPEFSAGKNAALALGHLGFSNEETESLVAEINSRAVEIWELESLIERLKEKESI